MSVKSAMRSIIEHVHKTIEELDDKQIDNMVEIILKAEKIFLVGSGRSGMAVKAFAMRLSQLGLRVYVVGETITPAMSENDLLIAVSGSGETSSVCNAARITKSIGARVLAVTSYPDSTLGRVADDIVVVKGRTKIDVERHHLRSQLEGKHTTLTPLGTLFEDTVMIFFDGIIVRLMQEMGECEDSMKKRHTVLE